MGKKIKVILLTLILVISFNVKVDAINSTPGKNGGRIVKDNEMKKAMNEIVSFAKKQLGKPYEWAASGPNSFDCSGFSWYVMKSLGYTGGRGSAQSQTTAGIPVDKKNLAPGDLIFFGSPAHHVGIYIGNGEFIHARGDRPRSKWKTVETTRVDSYYKPIQTIRRYFFTQKESDTGKGANHGVDSVSGKSEGSNGEVTNVHNFGIKSVNDMPDLPGCSNNINKDLYYGGLAAGVDPAFLKVIAKRETTCGAGKKISTNGNSKNYGLMQVNTSEFSKLGINSSNAQKLHDDDLMNIWAATQTIKSKRGYIKKNYKGKTIAGRVVKEDAFTLLWFYNSANKHGLPYAKDVNAEYLKITKVKKSAISDNYKPSNIDILLGGVAYATSQGVHMDEVIVEGSMTYEQFSKRLKDITEGNGVIGENNGSGGSSSGDYKEYIGIKDESSGAGVDGEVSEIDTAINYTIYRVTVRVIKILNWIIGALILIATVVISLVWVGWILAKSGVPLANGAVIKFTRGEIDAFDEVSFIKLRNITVVVVITLSLILSGTIVRALSFVLEKLLL